MQWCNECNDMTVGPHRHLSCSAWYWVLTPLRINVCIINQHNIKVAMANQSATEFLESSKWATSISGLFILGYIILYFSQKSMT